MAKKEKYLITRDGRYHARIVVPQALRAKIGKIELSASLGADRRQAIRDLPRIIGQFQDQLATARASLTKAKGTAAPQQPIDPAAVARAHYQASIALDQEIRDNDHRYAATGFAEEQEVEALKRVVAGKADTNETLATMANILALARHQELASVPRGTAEWRILMRFLAQAELAAMNVSAHRDEAEPDPSVPDFLKAPFEPEAAGAKSIRALFDGYRIELQGTGKGRGAEKRWAPVIESLISFVSHDVASRITRPDAVRWKDHLLQDKSPKTVRDFYVATARAAFSWAVDNLHVKENPFAGMKVRFAKKTVNREKGFNDTEALEILKAARRYKGGKKEHPTMTAAKRWSPVLAAYNGARIGELMQLRKEDVRENGGIRFLRITPEAGSVKSREFRDVPLHSHVIALGFWDFVKASAEGPLFYKDGVRKGVKPPAQIVGDRVASWVRSLKIIEGDVAPNHGWRHRLKSVGREIGMDGRVLDAIQGHAARTAGDDYGNVSLKAKQRAIEMLPTYDLD